MNTEPRRSRAVKKDPAVAKKPAVRRKSPAKKPLAETETEVVSVTTPPPVPQQEEMAVEQITTTPPAEQDPVVDSAETKISSKRSNKFYGIASIVGVLVLVALAMMVLVVSVFLEEGSSLEVVTVEIEYVTTPYESFTLLPDTVVQIDNHLEVELPAEQEPSLDLLHEFSNGERLILNSGKIPLNFKIKHKQGESYDEEK